MMWFAYISYAVAKNYDSTNYFFLIFFAYPQNGVNTLIRVGRPVCGATNSERSPYFWEGAEKTYFLLAKILFF